MTDNPEVQTDKEQTAPRKPDGVLTRKFGAKPLLPRYFSTTAARTHFKISC